MSSRRPRGHNDAAATAELFTRARTDPSAREELAEMHRPLAESLSRRYLGFGEPIDDLVQVASIGLLNAIDRFDPERGTSFVSFAAPTIIGELKRHFRDRGWAVRVPRRLQENTLELRRAVADLSQKLGRSPTIAELAEETAMSEDDVLEASDAMLAYGTTSLDAPIAEDMTLGETLPADDPTLDVAETWADLKPLLATLPDRERRILGLRFFRGLTQTEIAEEIGISQMHVSRLLGRALDQLRDGLTKDAEADV